MNPGETFVDFDYDDAAHLWIVLSAPDERGRVALAPLTTHSRRRATCDRRCLILRPGDHSFVRRDSCVAFQLATFDPTAAHSETHPRRTAWPPLTPALLLRIQEAAVRSRAVTPAVKTAIQGTLAR